MLKKLWKQLCSDWVRILMALIMAALIYVLRSDIFSSEESTRKINDIPITLELSSDIINFNNSTQSTALTVRGPADKLPQLTPDQIKIIVKVSKKDLGKGLIELSMNNIKMPSGFKVTHIHSPLITVNLEAIDSKKVPVKAIFNSLSNLPENYSVSNISVFPMEVTISGPSSKIKNITSVDTADIPLDNAVQNSFKYTAKIKNVDDVNIAPDKVLCEINIIQKFATRTIKKVPVMLLVPNNKNNLEFKLHPQEVDLQIYGPSRSIHFVSSADFYVFINTAGITKPGEYVQKIYYLSTDPELKINTITPMQLTVIAREKAQ